MNGLICVYWCIEGLVITAVAFLPIAILNSFCAAAMGLLGQPHDVAVLSGPYCHFLLMGLPFVFVYNIWSKTLQARGCIWPLLVSGLFSNLMTALIAYLFMGPLKLSFESAAVARSLGTIV